MIRDCEMGAHVLSILSRAIALTRVLGSELRTSQSLAEWLLNLTRALMCLN